ncbi:hypothetical protein EJ08DRAFT_80889 [Tothia fuscella]|uniref:Uncharacterized protein n=1 Tax=Tothia fuscella TaxID=1048955 RepID=A0A9P4NEG1_9PEZI|nr:hypothetical protein EJ08DRAFT_80889 [Tothia fuscella]
MASLFRPTGVAPNLQTPVGSVNLFWLLLVLTAAFLPLLDPIMMQSYFLQRTVTSPLCQRDSAPPTSSLVKCHLSRAARSKEWERERFHQYHPMPVRSSICCSKARSTIHEARSLLPRHHDGPCNQLASIMAGCAHLLCAVPDTPHDPPCAESRGTSRFVAAVPAKQRNMAST